MPISPQMVVPPPPFSEADVVVLMEMFPALGRDVVESVLTSSGGNKDAAINTLLAL